MPYVIIVCISGLLIVLLLIFIGIYNKIIKKANQVSNSEGSMNVMLKKRFDLIPNLVNTAQAYMKYEKEIYEQIAAARYDFSKAAVTADRLDANIRLSSSLNMFYAVVENYPDLKANELMINLMYSLNETEEQISAARRFYNTAVTEYNNSIMTFPSNIIASIANFNQLQLFQIDESEKINIQL